MRVCVSAVWLAAASAQAFGGQQQGGVHVLVDGGGSTVAKSETLPSAQHQSPILANFVENQCSFAGGTAALAAHSKHIRDNAKKVAVVVPTHDHGPHGALAVKLAQSFAAVKPQDTELFFVFGRMVLGDTHTHRAVLQEGDGGIAKFRESLLTAMGVGEEGFPEGVHTIDISEYERSSVNNAAQKKENYISAKKWFGMWEVLHRSGRFRYAVAMDDEALFLPRGANHSLFDALEAKMRAKQVRISLKHRLSELRTEDNSTAQHNTTTSHSAVHNFFEGSLHRIRRQQGW